MAKRTSQYKTRWGDRGGSAGGGGVQGSFGAHPAGLCSGGILPAQGAEKRAGLETHPSPASSAFLVTLLL